MRRALTVAGLSVAGVVAFVLVGAFCHRLESPVPVAVVTALLFSLAAWVATPESREMCRLVERALDDIGMSKQAAAITAEMTEAQFSRQLNSVDQLSLSRLSALGHDFEEAFALRLLERRGRYTVVENGVLSDAVDLLASMVRGRSVAA